MKRGVRWAAVSVGIAGVITAVTLAPGGATPPEQLAMLLLARGTNTSVGTVPVQFGTDVVFVQITVQPGGVSGWHSHPGGAIIDVQQGSLTVYASVGSTCETKTYTAGQVFVERPGEVDQVKNTGTIPYVLYVVFPRVPKGASPRTDEPNPGTCPGV